MSLDNGGSPGTDQTPPSRVRTAAEPAPNGPPGAAAVAEIERALGKIAGVRAARVVADAGGRVAEIHVLAAPGRAPKQLVRDIQSAVLTGFGVTIDYRVVSVVQLEHDDQPAPASRAPRPVLRRLSAETASFSTEVQVGVAFDGNEVARTTRGPATAGLRLVAQATVDAVSELISAEAAEVETAEIVPAGQRQIAVVVLRMLTGRGDHLVSGSAIVRRDPGDAVARAALAAVNRFVGAV